MNDLSGLRDELTTDHAGPSRPVQVPPTGAVPASTSTHTLPPEPTDRPLSLPEYERYGRQMILPGFGLPGQVALRRARVAVVGAGGLGCPVLQYLAGAGVGTIAIFDPDTVSISNLHRQILHTSDRVGMSKAHSAKLSLQDLNPLVQVEAHDVALTASNALVCLSIVPDLQSKATRPEQPAGRGKGREELQAAYDILVDCTDRPYTRYLLNDVAVLLGIPLVSGAAISTVGQWAVYGGYAPTHLFSPANLAMGTDQRVQQEVAGTGKRSGNKRACYRCLWPKYLGEGAGSGGRCEETGVLGVVTGMVGVGMAGEVMRLLTGVGGSEDHLHMYTFGASPLVRTVRMRPPSLKCIACGPNATLTTDLEKMDYDTFCAGPQSLPNGTHSDRAGTAVERIWPQELRDLLRPELSEGSGSGISRGSRSTRGRVRLVDTRSETEFGICSIPGSINIPFDTIRVDPASLLRKSDEEEELVFICRQGNDSLVAAGLVTAATAADKQVDPLNDSADTPTLRVRDVRGGLVGWSKHVDPSFPIY